MTERLDRGLILLSFINFKITKLKFPFGLFNYTLCKQLYINETKLNKNTFKFKK